jgi:hypothetical protein
VKRFLQVSIVVVLALTLVLTTFSVRGPGPVIAGVNICPLVGWKTGPASCSIPSVATLLETQIRIPPAPTPNVGWKT